MLSASKHLLQDLRYAVRRLRRAPAFVIVSTLLIAISLAGSTVTFSLVDVLLLRSLPVRDPESLVQIFEIRPSIPPQENLSVDFRDLIAAESTTLTDIVGELEATTSLEWSAATSRVDVGIVTANYFETLGVETVLGRNLGRGDDIAGDRVAVLSHAAWTRRFGADPSVVGQSVRLGDLPYQIVGVLPEGFNGTTLDSGPDLRVLFANRADFGGPRPNATSTKIIARLRQEASLDSARAETRALWSRYRDEFLAGGGVAGDFDRDLSVDVRSISRGTSRVREQFQGTLLLLFGGASLVLVMVCLNVGSLFLARVVQSRQDAAIRRALGASRGRIARQWVVETTVVAVIGGIGGILLSGAAMPALVRWLSPLIGFASFGRPPTLDVSVDVPIAAFGLVVMLSTGIVAALVPVFWWARKDSYQTLKASTDDRENRRIQSGLSVVQIALSTVLLLAGGLMIRTLDSLNAVDTGFDREMLVRIALDPAFADYDGSRAAGFQRRLLAEAAELPGVEAVALATMPVMQGFGLVANVALPGQPAAEGSWNTNVNTVTSGYFDTMGMELLRGTVFDDRLVSPQEPLPVVVNEAFARKFFGDQSALGRVFDSGVEFETPSRRIVGVVSDANYRSLRESDPPIFYTNPLSLEPANASAFSLLVRTATPNAVIEPVRAIVRSIDPALPVIEAITMSDEVDRSLWKERLATALASGFAAVGLAVATIGLYGILAHYVASRRKEIGLRVALGAREVDVFRLVTRQIMLVLLLGSLAGAAAHLALGRWLASLLYNVRTLDPAVVTVSGAALLLTSLLAAVAPVRRAIRVDPARTLRQD